MSASSTPTRSPLARSPSARLAATVDLPTPPLPEATATIAPTPGAAPRRRLRLQHGGHREHSGQRLYGLFRRLAQRLEARAALAFDLDREGDIAVPNDQPRYHAERDDIGALDGVRDMAECVEDLLFGISTHLIL